jgi:hypothetical protein
MLGKLSFTLLWGVVLAGAALAQAAEPVPSTSGVLVLRNGSVLNGQVVRAGDHYLITGEGVETRLRAGDVDFFCRDLKEAYARKRLLLQPEDWEARFSLAHWCLRLDLLDGAQEQVAAIQAVAPKSRRAEALAGQIADRRNELANPRPKSDAGPAGPRSSDLELLVRGLPSNTVANFTDVIQPLLLNNCAAAGCHGARSTAQFRLLKPSRGPSRRLTHRNLHATVAWIDRADPARSRLLTAAGDPHGGLSLPIFSRAKATHYRQLAAWVSSFGSASAAEAAEPVTVSHAVPLAMSPLSESAAMRPIANRAGSLRRMGSGRSNAPDMSAPTGAQSDVAQAAWFEEQPANQVVAARPARTPAPRGGDPLDPEVFNRQFAPAKPAPPAPIDEMDADGFDQPSPNAREQAIIDQVEAELQALGMGEGDE